MTWDIDLEIESSAKPWLLSSGCEWEVTKALMLRGGLTQDALPGGSTTTNITLGLGLRINRITFDYGYKIDSLISDANLGYFSITYNFGDKHGLTQKEKETQMGTDEKKEVKGVKEKVEVKEEVKEKAKDEENKEIKEKTENIENKENKKEEIPAIKNKVMEI
jgi:hypothetical protein